MPGFAGEIRPVPAAAEPPRRPGRRPPDAAQTLRLGLGRQLDRLEANLERDDPKTIHDLRVATRRVRAALSLWRFISDPRGLRRARRAVRRLGRSLGALREADVNVAQLRSLAGPGEANPAAREAAVALELARAGRLRKKVRRARRRFDVEALRRELQKAILHPGEKLVSGPDLERFAGIVVSAASQHVRDLGEKALRSGDPAALHAVRIRVKKCRYAVELLSPAFGKDPGRRALKSLKTLQDRLGRLQDLVVLRARVEALRRRAERDALLAIASGLDELRSELARRQREEIAVSKGSVEAFLRRGILAELKAGGV